MFIRVTLQVELSNSKFTRLYDLPAGYPLEALILKDKDGNDADISVTLTASLSGDAPPVIELDDYDGALNAECLLAQGFTEVVGESDGQQQGASGPGSEGQGLAGERHSQAAVTVQE